MSVDAKEPMFIYHGYICGVLLSGCKMKEKNTLDSCKFSKLLIGLRTNTFQGHS